ncbi:phenylalanine--tRNA ligase subunit beta [Lactobacillus hominis]|uniref:Phenylalanine--tRNA ligase beta subunit n=1 Tax=Lactobacillus hominis DSM 23910 = CRBIP 24.179 TaxID=1423758 RepID=I7KH44_9LACO|nr:phenylalanine--tRNA ligase subunit beta [Lactobacillus hominis]KRM85673.1 phenylalanyl-tRNA synthetase beta chain [Lactobacillus hominis DSM 23910 = CRBIP 24.179]MCT3347278.1 phenylalanine--tRNA ligase subunit beta [Lactobacillus hominis]CCI81805.1 Phenylalanyl-tRNA synthetase beta chain [Lactobacillus hominis DSM 23910 = CRBIP 24.179]
MLVSYNWLQDFLDLDEDPKDLAEKITRTGVEIASVVHPQEGLKKLVVGHILECETIEGTHLHKCQVDVGEEEPIQIVCGAPNVAAGEDVIVALHGARIAGNEKIKRGKIRGIQSNGMICGLQEIGFADKVVPEKYANGIWVFSKDSDVKPGQDVYEALGMDDYILDFDITPNRADTLSMEGAAYEVGAIVDQKPKIENPVLKEDGPDWTDELQVSVDKDLAPKFYLRKVTGVKIGESPMWMQKRLWNAGIRPINNVVDVTNYIMLLTGQPMHAYDARSFASGKLEVRKANKGEKLTLLNDKEVDLDPNDIVITDGQKPVMMAGVMGGKNSEVEDDTTDVILESAIFDGTLVRKAALRHANRTEASSRFEKGVNWDNTQKALDMATILLRNDASATVAAGEIKASDEQRKPEVIKTAVSYINKVLGTQLTRAEMEKIFDRLDFNVDGSKDELIVTVPNRRWDISIPADLVEEVGRIYGYDNLKSTQPLLAETHGGYSEKETAIRRIKRIVQDQGLMEAISYSLTSPAKAVAFTKDPKETVQVQWPLNSSRSTMRENLMTGLVDAAAYNMARKEKQLAFYEQGRVYDHDNGQFNEHEHLATLYSGTTFDENWQHENQKIDFYFVKGQLENLFTALGLDNNRIVYKAENINWMHPTRTAGIYIDDQYVGMIGMLAHMVTMAEKSLHGSELYGYELDLDKVISFITKGMHAKEAPKYPAIKRDLSLLLDTDVTDQQVIDEIEKAGGKYLQNIKVIDVYSGSHIEKGKKSIAYTLTFLNEKDTLTDDVVNKAVDKIIADLKENLNVSVR